jgi:hypothetical protein
MHGRNGTPIVLEKRRGRALGPVRHTLSLREDYLNQVPRDSLSRNDTASADRRNTPSGLAPGPPARAPRLYRFAANIQQTVIGAVIRRNAQAFLGKKAEARCNKCVHFE